MLFAKLFGGRRQEEPADPPTPPVQPRVVRPQAVVAPPAAAPTTKPAAPERHMQVPPAGSASGKDPSRGFDPYNSGAFNKSGAWERINRR